MTGLENSGSNRQAKEGGIYEDEINLVDYFLVLWKRKWFIFSMSVLPALTVGLAIFLGPRDLRISYIYNVDQPAKVFRVLENKFYSAENLEKLVEKLQEAGLDKSAEKLAEIKNAENLKKFVSFEISPSFFEAIKTSGGGDIEQLQKNRQVTETLLVMRIRAKAKENIRETASVCRKNFEQVIPLYSEREELNNKIIGFKEEMADIEETRYMLNLQLERKKSTLQKLGNSGSKGLDKLSGDVILQFNNATGNSAFLPLAYQVQAAETQIINLEEQIRANKEKYDYCTGLLKLNEKLFSHLEKLMSSYYTLERFRVFLTDTLTEYKENEEQLRDYLKAYIKRIENKTANVTPLVKKPKVYPVAKGTVRKSAVVFMAALMMSVFVSFLLEGLKKNRAHIS